VKTKFYRRFVAAWLIVSGLISNGGLAVADDGKESLVKAAFIYNFVKFVEWPDGKSIGKLSNIDICTVGTSSIDNAANVFKAASTAKLKLTLVQEKDWKSAASHCHIVFAGDSDSQQVIAGLKSQPVLTVSDTDNFAENGGMIGFVHSDNKIKIVVNTKAITGAGLRVDAQLLEIALKVIDK